MPFFNRSSSIRFAPFRRVVISRVIAASTQAWVIMAIIAVLPVASWGQHPSCDALHKARRLYDAVLADKDSSRAEWLRAIDALAASAKAEPPGGRHAGLLYAGRACIEVHRRYKNPGDLLRAIRLLNEFKTLTRDDADWIIALKEMKRAHLLSRSVQKERRGVSRPFLQSTLYSGDTDGDASGSTRIQAFAGPSPPSPNAQPQHPTYTPAPPDRGFVAHQSAPIQGNPFYLGQHRSAGIPKPPVQEASLQSSATIVDSTERAVPCGSIKPDMQVEPEPVPEQPDPFVNVRSPEPERRFVVVIDPGHGGKDPGAVSSDGKLKEKDVTLTLAKRIKARLEARTRATGITVSLTRSDDSFLSVSERTASANAANGDIFISIHCNAYPDPSASGVETYFLSKARSRRAMMVAARENGIPLSRMTDLEATLVDLMVTSKKSESEKLAHTVHESLTSTIRLPRSRMNRGVRQAPFYVLLGVTTPAVLVECAYMSNSKESALLASPHYLNLVAEGIARGAESYVKGLQDVFGQHP